MPPPSSNLHPASCATNPRAIALPLFCLCSRASLLQPVFGLLRPPPFLQVLNPPRCIQGILRGIAGLAQFATDIIPLRTRDIPDRGFLNMSPHLTTR